MVAASYALKAKPVEILSSVGAPIARASCSRCGAHDDWRIANLPPPDILHRHFTVRGWDVRRKILCPQCQSKEPKMNTVTPIKPAETKTEPTDAAKKVKRQIYLTLEDAYDDAKKRYREGWTDKRVAEETGGSESFVKTIREADFGPLNEPPELRDIRTALAALTSEAGKLTNRLNELCKKNGWVA